MKEFLRVAVLCEQSGIVRNAFTALGHYAVSVDLKESSSPGLHVVTDAMAFNCNGFDLVLAFPPCTFLTYAGAALWDNVDRVKERIKAADFFMNMYCKEVSHVCVENPQGIMMKFFRNPDQIIHPYMFGDSEMKRTCLWLRGLPPLVHTHQRDLFNNVPHVGKPSPKWSYVSKKTGRINRLYYTGSIGGRDLNRSVRRSITFPGIAQAMASQWSEYLMRLYNG